MEKLREEMERHGLSTLHYDFIDHTLAKNRTDKGRICFHLPKGFLKGLAGLKKHKDEELEAKLPEKLANSLRKFRERQVKKFPDRKISTRIGVHDKLDCLKVFIQGKEHNVWDIDYFDN